VIGIQGKVGREGYDWEKRRKVIKVFRRTRGNDGPALPTIAAGSRVESGKVLAITMFRAMVKSARRHSSVSEEGVGKTKAKVEEPSRKGVTPVNYLKNMGRERKTGR